MFGMIKITYPDSNGKDLAFQMSDTLIIYTNEGGHLTCSASHQPQPKSGFVVQLGLARSDATGALLGVALNTSLPGRNGWIMARLDTLP